MYKNKKWARFGAYADSCSVLPISFTYHYLQQPQIETNIYIFFFPLVESESEVAQSCPTVCNTVDWSPPGSSIHGILWARILEWVAISFFRGSSQPRDLTHVSRIAGGQFNLWATRESHFFSRVMHIFLLKANNS